MYGPWVLLTKKVCRPKSLARINPAGLKSRSRQIWVQYAGNYSQSPQAIRVRRPRTARRLHRLQTGSPNEASCRSLRPSQSRSAHREPQFGLKHSPEVVASHRPSCPCTVSGAPCQQVQTLPGRRETLAPASCPARPCGAASAVTGASDAYKHLGHNRDNSWALIPRHVRAALAAVPLASGAFGDCGHGSSRWPRLPPWPRYRNIAASASLVS